MGFNIINSVIDHTSDAGFRAWAQELDAAFIAAGWVNTSDTGQVNLSTMLRPAINTVAGYRTYYYNDSLHASAPIFLRMEFGTGSSATFPTWFVQFGQGTNGSGSLTGLTSARTSCVALLAPASTSTPYPTYVSWGEGYFGIGWKVGGSNNGMGFLLLNRFTDSLGTPLGSGYCVYPRGSATSTLQQQCVSYSALAVYAANTAYGIVGGNVTNSLIGGVAQTYRHYVITPRMQLNPFALTVINAELVHGSTFQADVVGTGLKDWMPLGACVFAVSASASSTNYGIAVPWN